jgi:hypothetical protein
MRTDPRVVVVKKVTVVEDPVLDARGRQNTSTQIEYMLERREVVEALEREKKEAAADKH